MADFHSKMSVYRHELGGGATPTIPWLEDLSVNFLIQLYDQQMTRLLDKHSPLVRVRIGASTGGG